MRLAESRRSWPGIGCRADDSVASMLLVEKGSAKSKLGLGVESLDPLNNKFFVFSVQEK